MAFHLGSQIDWTVTFTASDGTEADPGAIDFALREEVDGTELAWIYNASPVEGTDFPLGMLAMVKDATGEYRVPYIARKPERLTGVFTGSGTIFQSTEVTAFVNHSGVESIENG